MCSGGVQSLSDFSNAYLGSCGRNTMLARQSVRCRIVFTSVTYLFFSLHSVVIKYSP